MDSRRPMVGRSQELARMRRHVDEAARGQGRLVLVAGEPGIGKSRLCAETVEAARRGGLRTAWGSCRETEGAPPYWPWSQVLRGLVDQSRADDVLAPLLRTGGSLPRSSDRFLLFDGVARTLADTAAVTPVLVVLDDVHRADEPSVQLLRFVVDCLRGCPLLLVCTYRDTELAACRPLARLVGDLAGSDLLDVLELTGLTGTDAAHLISLERPDASSDEVSVLFWRTAGNPFFLTELLRLDADRAEAVPATIEAAIRTRVEDLPPPTRELLAMAAVLGRDVPGRHLAALADRRELALLATLEPAVQRRILLPQHDAPGDYRFAHVLVQQTLYASLPAQRRLELHDRAAKALERLVGTDPAHAAELAYHACAATALAGGRGRAFTLAVRAAEVAVDRLADESAVSWYARAQAIGAPDEEHRIKLLLGLGRAAGRAGDTDRARRAFEQAWADAAAADRLDDLVSAALGLGEVIVSAPTVDAGLVRMLERTLERVEKGAARDRIRLTGRLAIELYWSDGLERGRALAAAAVAAARQEADDRTVAAALAAHQFVLRGPDDLAERLALGEELAEIALRLDDDELELHARRVLVPDRLQENPVRADQELRALEALAEATGRPLARWYALHYRATRMLMTGHHDQARHAIDASEALGRRLGVQPATPYATGQRFVLLRQTGRVVEAEAAVRDHAARWPVAVTYRTMLTLLLAVLGRRDEALALLDELTEGGCTGMPRDSLWLASVAMLGEAAALLGSQRHAAILRQVLQPYRGRIAMQGVVAWYGAVDRYLALLATTLGDWEPAEEGFRAALRIHETWAAVPLIRATLVEHAAMLRCRGTRADRARASELTVSAGTRRGAGPAELTAREDQVLALLADGASNKDIARQLALSVHTVERHIANVYTKIGARNRAEATAIALRTRHASAD